MMLHADVNLDGAVTAADALQVINSIDQGEYSVPKFTNIDVNGDLRVSAVDALQVINEMARVRDNNPRVFTFRLGPISTYGLTREQVLWGINEAFREWEKAGNLDFRITDSGSISISSGELYLGNGYHARGWVRDGLRGRVIQFHSGYVSAGHHSGSLGPKDEAVWWRAISSPQALKQIMMHEIGHSVVMGLDHSSNPQCVMNINSSVDKFCSYESDIIGRTYR